MISLACSTDADWSDVGTRHIRRISNYETFIIRAIDIVGSLGALIFFLPVLIAIGLAVYISNPGPVFFWQRRIGRNGQAFNCFKFRTMATDSQERLRALLASDPQARQEWELNHKLRNDPRIVGIGGFLRKSSLDELPQFLNVLRGDMSLVGPRPIVAGEVSRYRRYFTEYCSMRPGLTGLWQISGRSNVSYRRRVALDVHYCRSMSLKLYLHILIMTVPCVVLGVGSF